jgi:hypothetical protein
MVGGKGNLYVSFGVSLRESCIGGFEAEIP